MLPALCQHCLVTDIIAQPGPKAEGHVPSTIISGLALPCGSDGLSLLQTNKEKCVEGLKAQSPAGRVGRAGCPDLGEAGNFPWWVWIPRETVRSWEAGNFCLVQNNIFFCVEGGSFLLGLASMVSFIQVQRQARASDFPESLPPTPLWCGADSGQCLSAPPSRPTRSRRSQTSFLSLFSTAAPVSPPFGSGAQD